MAVTTTSFSELKSFSRTTVIPSVASTSWVFMPRQETMRVFVEVGTFRENLPSTPEIVPVFVPSTTIPAPGTGALSSAEMTVPDTLRV